MTRRTPRCTRTDTLFPDTTPFRSTHAAGPRCRTEIHGRRRRYRQSRAGIQLRQEGKRQAAVAVGRRRLVRQARGIARAVTDEGHADQCDSQRCACTYIRQEGWGERIWAVSKSDDIVKESGREKVGQYV